MMLMLFSQYLMSLPSLRHITIDIISTLPLMPLPLSFRWLMFSHVISPAPLMPLIFRWWMLLMLFCRFSITLSLDTRHWLASLPLSPRYMPPLFAITLPLLPLLLSWPQAGAAGWLMPAAIELRRMARKSRHYVYYAYYWERTFMIIFALDTIFDATPRMPHYDIDIDWAADADAASRRQPLATPSRRRQLPLRWCQRHYALYFRWCHISSFSPSRFSFYAFITLMPVVYAITADIATLLLLSWYCQTSLRIDTPPFSRFTPMMMLLFEVALIFFRC